MKAEFRLRTDIVFYAAKVDELRNLIENGECNAAPENNMDLERVRSINTLHNFCRYVLVKVRGQEDGNEVLFTSLEFAVQVIRLYQDEFHHVPARFVLINSVLEGVVRKLMPDNSYRNYIQCLRLVFRTIRNPIVTINEVREYMKEFQQFLPLEDSVLDGICEELLEIYPESNSIIKPRSLLHLSRCAIREYYNASLQGRFSSQFPRTVSMLNIPRYLQEILLLTAKED